MPDGFIVESSSEFGINIRHEAERHLYLFAISEDESGERKLAAPSVRASKNAKHAPESFRELACVFVEKAAHSLGLLTAEPLIDPIEPANPMGPDA